MSQPTIARLAITYLTGAQDTGPSKMFCFRFVGLGDMFTSYFLFSHSQETAVMWSEYCLAHSVSSLSSFWQTLFVEVFTSFEPSRVPYKYFPQHINSRRLNFSYLCFREWLKIQVFHSHMPTSAECKLKEGSNAAGAHSLQIGTCLPADNSQLCPGQDLNCVRKRDTNACSN